MLTDIRSDEAKMTKTMQEKQRIYESQWEENADECISCKYCDVIIAMENAYKLPKECECKWYTDTEATDRCKYCHEPYHYNCKDCLKPCTKCYWAWDTDDKGGCWSSFCYAECVLLEKKTCSCDDEDVDS